MRIGLYGGSFDPIHAGHLEPARAALEALSLEKVIYLPTGRPPHKPGRRFAPALARFAMVEMALLHEEACFASPFELREDRPSYTIETVEHFRLAWPGAEIFVIMGSDSFSELTTWRRWRELAVLARLAVLTRPGWETEAIADDLEPELQALLASDRVHTISHPPVAISATEIRALLAAGGTLPEGAVPQLVLDYVAKYGLYQDTP